ncbi:hypothetical protein [Candidatus Nitrosarchaeum limnium]|uniref:Uncharacterized protein n=1 Tax=Candidatus Nitrosarchaeum limnium BG20 TaxID=859192 RepID=S2E0N9_9ARCH|nr:hypothetical protein [Candidatus Nitrosarchaeum limnium]EPA04488.1 hypothetical protein BG20_I1553 [Candidatus Nitrosarchaeum limnium BG20]
MNEYTLTSIGIEDATNLYNEMLSENHFVGFGNSWKYWVRHRNITKNLITICGIEIPFHKVGNKICVNKQELIKKIQDDIKKKIEIKNGPIEVKGTVIGDFVELSRWDSGMIGSYYICRKCKSVANMIDKKLKCSACPNPSLL